MVGTASPVMKKYIKYPTRWVAKNKIKSILGRPICVDSIPHYEVGQDPKQGDLRESGEVVLKKNDFIKDEVVLTEEEMADMLRAD
jgi:hypothetical protein